MTSILVKGRELYAALASGDAEALGRLLALDGQRFTAVHQVTDTAKWHEALAVG